MYCWCSAAKSAGGEGGAGSGVLAPEIEVEPEPALETETKVDVDEVGALRELTSSSASGSIAAARGRRGKVCKKVSADAAAVDGDCPAALAGVIGVPGVEGVVSDGVEGVDGDGVEYGEGFTSADNSERSESPGNIDGSLETAPAAVECVLPVC